MTTSSSPPFAFEQLAPPTAPEPPRSLDDARSEAEALLAAARGEAERIRADAYARGREEGLSAAAETARERIEPAVAALGAALEELQRERALMTEELEREAVALSLQLAEKVLVGALGVEPERVVDVVRGALRCLVERERVVILVNPDDLELVREAVEGLKATLGGIEHLEVQEERRVPRGGAVVRSPAGEVDARLQTKLERAGELLQRGLSGEPSAAPGS